MGVASDTYAELTREQYDNWLDTYYPVQKEYLEATQSGELLDEQLGRVDEHYEEGALASQTGTANRMARYGVTSEQDNNAGLRTSLAQVASKNALRDHEKERAMDALSGATTQAMESMEDV